MQTLIVQPIATRFGTVLLQEMARGGWSDLDVAVAWARSSGVRHLDAALRQYLAAGGRLRISVGVDLRGTSREGLDALLQIAGCGHGEIWVFHNDDSGAGTFHPKMYLLRGPVQATLMIGSSNLTEGGLFTNYEAGMLVRSVKDDPLMVDAAAAIASFRDRTLNLARKLDAALLAQLVARQYVVDEAQLPRSRRNIQVTGTAGTGGAPLFGRVRFRAPPVHGGGSGTTAAPAVPPLAPTGSSLPPPTTPAPAPPPAGPAPTAAAGAQSGVLLMRVRKSRGQQGQQVQLPKALVVPGAFLDVPELVSQHDGRPHPLIDTFTTRNGVRRWNTKRVDVPEAATYVNPVLRLERDSSGVTYTAARHSDPCIDDNYTCAP